MSYFRNISLNNYRNFTNSSFEFDNFCNIILGQNGSGKTNLLESLSLVEKGRGLRKEKISNLIKNPSSIKNFNITCNFINNSSAYQVNVFNEIKNDKNYKKTLINGSDDLDSLNHFENLYSFIYFLPEMERLFVASPSIRRNFIDRLIYTNNKRYNLTINNYKKSIAERQKILKLSNYDSDWIDQLEKNIVIYGSEIYKKRLYQVEKLNLILSKLDILKNSSHKFNLELIDKIFFENEIKDINNFDYIFELSKNRKYDLFSGGCTIGPHRSDIVGHRIENNFSISQLSTGQQKTVILLIIIAQCKYLLNLDLKPIILLDEVCSHLDNDNRQLLLYLIEELKVQVFMTGTEKSFFSFLSTNAYYCNIV